MLELCPLYSDINRLSTGCLQLGLRLLDLDIGDQSSLIEVLIQLQRILVLDDGILQKLLFCIQTTGCEVVEGQVRMHAEINAREVSGAGLRLGAIGLDRATDAPPDISFVGQLKGQHKIVEGDAAKGRVVGRAIE